MYNQERIINLNLENVIKRKKFMKMYSLLDWSYFRILYIKVVEKLCIRREKVNFKKRIKYMMYEMSKFFQVVIITVHF